MSRDRKREARQTVRPKHEDARSGAATATRVGLSGEQALRLYRPDLASALDAELAPPYRHAQVYEHLLRHPEVPLSDSTVLPGALQSRLAPLLYRGARVAGRTDDRKGTTKLLVALDEDEAVETVVMRYPERTTVCVSTQIGCPVGCVFCATGRMGFRRNLTTAELVDQVRLAAALVAPEGRRITNVVFMGMGEPLLNTRALFPAIDLLRDSRGLSIRSRGISVSTVGIPSGIVELAKRAPQANLALSLHAPWDALRRRLIPIARTYPLQTVLEAVDTHFALTRRKLLVEYTLLRGLNDGPECAAALADLVRGRVAAVNLIVLNEVQGSLTQEGSLAPSPPHVVAAFRAELEERGVDVSLRAGKGSTIVAACGQLATSSGASAPDAGHPRHPRGPHMDGSVTATDERESPRVRPRYGRGSRPSPR